MVKRGRSWLGVDRRRRRSSKGVDCDILTQDLIGLIKYSYHQGISSFVRSPPVKNSEVKRAWPGAILRWVTNRKVFPGAHE
jgi:hypothetical protein